MTAGRLLATLACSTMLASGAEMRGSWSASSGGGNLAGTWTAEAHQDSGGVTGAWTVRDASGKILMSGGWSASKSPKSWNGAWRATVEGHGANTRNVDGRDTTRARIAPGRDDRVCVTRSG